MILGVIDEQLSMIRGRLEEISRQIQTHKLSHPLHDRIVKFAVIANIAGKSRGARDCDKLAFVYRDESRFAFLQAPHKTAWA
jgi:hypothetical protein